MCEECIGTTKCGCEDDAEDEGGSSSCLDVRSQMSDHDQRRQ